MAVKINVINESELSPKELFENILKFKNLIYKDYNMWFWFSFSLFDLNAKANKYNINSIKNSLDKNKNLYLMNLSFDFKSPDLKLIKDEFEQFLINIKPNLKNAELYYSINKKLFDKKISSFCIVNDISNINGTEIFPLNLNIGNESLDKNNIFELLKLYKNFNELNNQESLKTFRTLFFGKIKSKLIEPFFDELANENKIILEKSSIGAIKSIIIIKEDLNPLTMHLNKLKKNGIIKTTWSYNSDFYFEINSYKPLESFKVKFEYTNEKIKLFIYNDAFSYFVKLTTELGEFDNLKNKLESKILDVINELEIKLEFKILNKKEFSINDSGYELNILSNI